MTVISRPFREEADYDRMRTLLIDSFPLLAPRVYCTVGDLDWWRWTDEDPQAISSAQLWFDGDECVIGFVWPSLEKRQADVIVHPASRAREVEMLEWAEAFVRESGGDDARGTFTAWSFAGDDPRQAMLRDRGYRRQDGFLAFRSRSLSSRVLEPVLPPGYRLRHVRGDEDVERRVAVHRDAFAPSRMTVAKHRAVMRSPTYRADLDLVVEADDGSFAAYCIVWFDEVNRIGLFEPVGTHSEHRQRGLGKAVLNDGMRRLQALGAETAYVYSWLADGPAAALYDSVGLTVLDRNYQWERTL